ncbi:MAG TPA: hypothetical protein VMK31_09520 [Sphingomicrobium sp.]|nr:hypothetical protein [Sphingomicrobium sp.]
MIEVTQTGSGDPLEFEVAVTEGGTISRHSVTIAAGDYRRLAGGKAPDRLVEAAFRFLLDREPKESILRNFDLSLIETYFPEFESKLPDYFGRTG